MFFDTFGELYIDGIGLDTTYKPMEYEGVVSSGAFAIPIVTDYTAWEYRNRLTIATDVTERVVTIPISYDSNMNTDFSDIRFSTLNGVNIPYYLVGKTDSTMAIFKIWASANDVMIYIYYGNSYAVSESSLLNTQLDKPLLHLTFDDSSIVDESGNDITLSQTNTTTATDRFGYSNNARGFNDAIANRITVSDSRVKGLSEFTYSTHINYATDAVNTYGGICHSINGSANDVSNSLRVITATGAVELKAEGTVVGTSSAGVIVAGTDQFVEITFDGTTTKVYIDDVEVISTAVPAWTNVNSSIYIGMGSSGSSTDFKGNLDEFRIYNYVTRHTENTFSFADDFNRADSTDLGADWYETYYENAIVSNVLDMTDNAGHGVVTTRQFSGDRAIEYEIQSGQTTDLRHRIYFESDNNAANGEYIRFSLGGNYIRMYDGGAWTAITADGGTGETPLGNSSKLKLEVLPTQNKLKVYINGNYAGYFNYTAADGSVGVLTDSAGIDMNIDNFKVYSYNKTINDFNPYFSNYVWNHMRYNKAIDVTDAPAIDAQYEIDIAHATGMQSNFGDVRFATDDGLEIQYWRESYVLNTSAKYWIKAPADTSRIRVYFGNSTAQYTGDGELVFELFDEFSSASVNTDIWEGDTSETISNGILTIDSTAVSVTSIQTISKFGIGYTVTCKAAMLSAGGNDSMFVGFKDAANNTTVYATRYNIGDSPYTTFAYRNRLSDGSITNVGSGLSRDSNTHIFMCSRKDVNNTIFSIDGAYGATIGTNVPSDDLPVIVGVWNSTSDMDVEWIRVSKYLATDPTFTINPTANTIGYCLYDWTQFEHQSTIIVENIPDAHTPTQLTFTKADYTVEMDLSDIRFCDTEGNYLPYWIEEDAATVTVWTITPAAATRFFMRYGNSGASDESNGYSIFEFFNNGSSLDGFTIEDGTPTASAGIITLSDVFPDPQILTSDKLFGPGYVLEGYIQANIQRRALFGFYDYSNNDWHGSFFRTESGSVWTPESVSADTWSYGSNIPNAGEAYARQRIEWIDNATVNMYYNDTLNNTFTTNVPQVDCHIAMRADASAATCTINADWIHLRKYVAIEPVLYTLPQGYSPDYIIPDATLENHTKRVTVTISDAHTSRYPVKETITYDADMNSDFSDLEFRDALGRRCPHWIETYTADTTATVWILTPANLSDIYMYYGNSEYVSVSNGYQIFPLGFDEFNGDADSSPSDMWRKVELPSTTQTTLLDGNGNAVLTPNDNYSNSVILEMIPPIYLSENISIEVKDKASNGYYIDTLIGSGSISGEGNTNNYWHPEYDNGIGFACQLGTTSGYLKRTKPLWNETVESTDFAPYPSLDTFYNHRYVITADRQMWYRDELLILDNDDGDLTLPTGGVHLGIAQGEYSTGLGGVRTIDWMGIRVYVSTEPSLSLAAEIDNPLYAAPGGTGNLNFGFIATNF